MENVAEGYFRVDSSWPLSTERGEEGKILHRKVREKFD